jgi:hypothetical protein
VHLSEINVKIKKKEWTKKMDCFVLVAWHSGTASAGGSDNENSVTKYNSIASRVTRDRCYEFKNIFAEKFSKNIGDFLLKLQLVFAKIVIITLVFEKNAKFLAENWQKTPKIVIITSTPDWANFRLSGHLFLWVVILKMTEVAQVLRYFLHGGKIFINFDKK